MKLRNKMDDIRALMDNGKFIEVDPRETIEVDRPVFNKNVFEIINTKKRKNEETLGDIKNEKLNIKEDK